MSVHVAFSSSVLTNIVFPLAALPFLHLLISFVWSSTSYHIETTSLLSEINIRPPGSDPQDKRRIVEGGMSSRAGIFSTMNRFSDRLLMIHWDNAKSHCSSGWTRTVRENPHMSPFDWVFFYNPPQHTHMHIAHALTTWLAGFYMMHMYTIRLFWYQFNTDLNGLGKR